MAFAIIATSLWPEPSYERLYVCNQRPSIKWMKQLSWTRQHFRIATTETGRRIGKDYKRKASTTIASFRNRLCDTVIDITSGKIPKIAEVSSVNLNNFPIAQSRRPWILKIRTENTVKRTKPNCQLTIASWIQSFPQLWDIGTERSEAQKTWTSRTLWSKRNTRGEQKKKRCIFSFLSLSRSFSVHSLPGRSYCARLFVLL